MRRRREPGLVRRAVAGLGALVEIGRTSVPSRKPQLWENFGFYLKRRLAFTVGTLRSNVWLDTPRVVQLREHRVLIEVVPRDYIGQSIFLYGMWEIVGTRVLDLLLKPGMRFVDIGANIGYYTLLAARRVQPDGIVYSFEPHDAIRAMLERSVALNGFGNVCVRSEAVTAASGVAPFYAVSQKENAGLSSTIPGLGTVQQPKYVPAVSLDDFRPQLADGRVDVIKIDVEGAEREVFAGMGNLLSSQSAPSAILFESTAGEECAELLTSYGYAVMGTHFTLRGGLEFIHVDDRQRIEKLMTEFRGQPTLDYLALKQDGPRASFAALARQSQNRLPWALRVLGAWA